ncbi:MAG: DEAD/DEAH box helicase [Thermoguttaceae bacterium]|nr:DEAD/DEAH box helicase [Thermoguttaceae bacterium]
MTRDEICEAFLAQVPYELYPMQEEALLAWFSSEQGVLVSAPTGMGKTLIAEAVVFEALSTGRRAYYTTPLIALTDQKFHELQVKAAQWGFDPNDVGLVTGNRKINPDAKILVVVAEILFNRLLQPESAAAESSALNFDDVDAVVMDEFHQFNDPERGIVWEFSLRLLPPRIRTLLLSATVGNAKQFAIWLETRHHRKLEVVESDERKVPLMFQWDEEHFLEDFVEEMALGDDETRRTPALLFCFSRDLCWDYAEILKGKKLISAEQQAQLLAELQSEKMTDGIGPKLKTMLLRGVGVHHAGVMPKYRRIVERCFQKKLLAVCACTETLSAGINLPARSVVLPSLLKGPKGKKKLVPFGTAHQIFGRAGRPQFDTQGYVFALAHPDDVKIARWQKKYDQIPENTPDPNLQKAKKQLKKKQPKRSPEEQYWSEKQFQVLQNAKAENLHSVGQIPWRLLAFMLQASPDVGQLRKLVQDRLLDSGRMERGQRDLDQALLTLHNAGYVVLEPAPPADKSRLITELDLGIEASPDAPAIEIKYLPEKETPQEPKEEKGFGFGLFDEEEELAISNEQLAINASAPEEDTEELPEENEATIGSDDNTSHAEARTGSSATPPSTPHSSLLTPNSQTIETSSTSDPSWSPLRAAGTEKMSILTQIRSINPLYGAFLLDQLADADLKERLQAFESVLEVPKTLLLNVRVPRQWELPPGRLAQSRLDKQLLQLGLATIDELVEKTKEEIQEERERFGGLPDASERVWVIPFAEKLYRLFQYEYPLVENIEITPVWITGEILEFNGEFNKYITSKGLARQEGLIFRHLLRMILLLEEFAQLDVPVSVRETWKPELLGVADALRQCCSAADPQATEEILAKSEEERESM